MQTRHLIATAVERDAVLGGVHLVLVRQALEVSAIGRCSAGAGLLRQQVAVGRHLVERAGVGDVAIPVGRHLVIVRDSAGLGVVAHGGSAGLGVAAPGGGAGLGAAAVGGDAGIGVAAPAGGAGLGVAALGGGAGLGVAALGDGGLGVVAAVGGGAGLGVAALVGLLRLQRIDRCVL